jgi:ribosomal protein S18 acetylase RimI-like enzyme
MMNVRKAQPKDINDVVAIHLQRFSHFFLTTLGASFLAVFYKSFLKVPGILLVLEEEGVIQGFAAGSLSNQGFFKKLLKNNLIGFMGEGIKILVTKPKALLRMASNAGKSEGSGIVFAELLSIATYQNKKGYGKILLDAFEKEVTACNKELLPISLTTDYENNEKAVQFYKDCGYTVCETFESYQNRKMYRFIKNLKS